MTEFIYYNSLLFGLVPFCVSILASIVFILNLYHRRIVYCATIAVFFAVFSLFCYPYLKRIYQNKPALVLDEHGLIYFDRGLHILWQDVAKVAMGFKLHRKIAYTQTTVEIYLKNGQHFVLYNIFENSPSVILEKIKKIRSH